MKKKRKPKRPTLREQYCLAVMRVDLESGLELARLNGIKRRRLK